MRLPKDTANNLDTNGECVISYLTKSDMLQMRITGCPVPEGIDEGDIAGYTYYQSVNVSMGLLNPSMVRCVMNCLMVRYLIIYLKQGHLLKDGGKSTIP